MSRWSGICGAVAACLLSFLGVAAAREPASTPLAEVLERYNASIARALEVVDSLVKFG